MFCSEEVGWWGFKLGKVGYCGDCTRVVCQSCSSGACFCSCDFHGAAQPFVFGVFRLCVVCVWAYDESNVNSLSAYFQSVGELVVRICVLVMARCVGLETVMTTPLLLFSSSVVAFLIIQKVASMLNMMLPCSTPIAMSSAQALTSPPMPAMVLRAWRHGARESTTRHEESGSPCMTPASMRHRRMKCPTDGV